MFNELVSLKNTLKSHKLKVSSLFIVLSFITAFLLLNFDKNGEDGLMVLKQNYLQHGYENPYILNAKKEIIYRYIHNIDPLALYREHNDTIITRVKDINELKEKIKKLNKVSINYTSELVEEIKEANNVFDILDNVLMSDEMKLINMHAQLAITKFKKNKKIVEASLTESKVVKRKFKKSEVILISLIFSLIVSVTYLILLQQKNENKL